MPLAETYALKGLAARGRAYGPVRLWGSAAFILGTFIAGFATDTIPARYLIWLIVAARVLGALAAFALEPLSAGAPPPSAPAAPRRAFVARSRFHRRAGGGQSDPGQPCGLLRLLGAAMARHRSRRHRDRGAVGAGRDRGDRAVRGARDGCRRSSSRSMLLMIGAAGGALRWAAMALDPPDAALPCAAIAARAVVRRHASRRASALSRAMRRHGQGATAQGYLSIAQGAAMAGGDRVYRDGFTAAFGGRAYAAMALAAVAGGVCGYVAHRARRVAAI